MSVPETAAPRTAPRRIQRKRTKGWRMPEGAVYVGRPTIWGNPWTEGGIQMLVPEATNGLGGRIAPFSTYPGSGLQRHLIVDTYRQWLAVEMDEFPSAWELDLAQIRGRDLACWCPLDQPCHADVLLEVANA